MPTYRNRNTDEVKEADGALADRLDALDNWERIDPQHQADSDDIDPGDLDAIEAQLAQLSVEQRNALREVLTRFEDPETGSEEPTEFDPGEHSVAEVNAYLDGVDDGDELVRVFSAEANGKARAGILTGPHSAKPAAE